MDWLVCKDKNSGNLFVQTRKERETMLSVLVDIKQQPASIVIKPFAEQHEADKYIIAINMVNDKLNSIF